MNIVNNRMVSLIYELRENDQNGRIIETLNETKPLKFIYGTGRLLPAFESNVSLLKKGDLFRFTLNSELAYGDKREEMVINVPVSVFETEGKLNEDICWVGNEVPMSDSEGNPLTGIINEITDSYVRMDFNHPMAGLNLFFSGKIVDVYEATDEEITALKHSCSSCNTGHENGCSGSCI
jgi:FKBP-type peptidyl-prolyl cis-trans isomerase SlyD